MNIPKQTVELTVPKYILIPYLMLLGVTLGAALSAGVFATSTIFNSEKILKNEVLSHFQEGLIMTKIFLKTNFLVNVTCISILIIESYHFFRFNRDKVTLLSSFVTVWTGFMFTLYYTPQILEFQADGESILDNELFQKAHIASEWDFKIFVAALALLLGRYLYRKVV